VRSKQSLGFLESFPYKQGILIYRVVMPKKGYALLWYLGKISFMTIDFGSIKSYNPDRGFGFVGHTFFNPNEKDILTYPKNWTMAKLLNNSISGMKSK
jgi:hypothetical protein